MATNDDIEFGIKIWNDHVKDFENKVTKNNGMVARKNVWRPHRFCVRDVVLALVALRFNLAKSYLEVDVCLSYNPTVFDPFSGTRIAMLFILSDAFMCGGSMEIHFTKRVEQGRVPSMVNLLARNVGLKLKHVSEGYITSAEAKALYFAITNLSDPAREMAKHLHNSNRISVERICFMVNNQIWKAEEMEMILLGAKHPEDVLVGSTSPLRRQLYSADIFQASGPILGTLFTRKLMQKETVTEKGEIIDIEADDKKLRVAFDPRFYAKVYTLYEDVNIPWLANGKSPKIKAGTKIVTMVRPRSAGHVHIFGGDDLKMLAKMVAAYEGEKAVFAILLPQDFIFLPKNVQDGFITKAGELYVQVIVCPEILENIDTAAMQKLERGQLVRR